MVPSQHETDDGETHRTPSNTRRELMIGSAGALGGLAAGGAFVGTVFGDSHENDDEPAENVTDDTPADDAPPEDPPDDDEAPEEVPEEAPFADDVEILNYALTAEYLQADFYRQGLETFDEEHFVHRKTFEKFGPGILDYLYDNLQLIYEQEVAHAEAIEGFVTDLGGEPVAEPTFDFGPAFEDPDTFIATGAEIEDVVVSAYAGAAPFVENPDVLGPALGIHSVEARHAGYLRTLTQQVAFPEAVDAPRTPEMVLDIVGPFIVE